jgi:hypothetical protein
MRKSARTVLCGGRSVMIVPTASLIRRTNHNCRYADVNGIKLYHEIYGQDELLVLIPGGLTTIGEMQGWVQPLAKTRRVIAVEMQGPVARQTRTGR